MDKVSIGQEDQLREAQMEQDQRAEDDGAPEGHERKKRLGDGKAIEKPVSGKDDEPWKGRADDPDHPGQTPEGGLGGSGPVQP